MKREKEDNGDAKLTNANDSTPPKKEEKTTVTSFK